MEHAGLTDRIYVHDTSTPLREGSLAVAVQGDRAVVWHTPEGEAPLAWTGVRRMLDPQNRSTLMGNDGHLIPESVAEPPGVVDTWAATAGPRWCPRRPTGEVDRFAVIRAASKGTAHKNQQRRAAWTTRICRCRAISTPILNNF